MVKKNLIVGLTAIILSLCCGLCFAAEGNNENSVNLGDEITKSVDKAGQSMQNLTDGAFSTNTVNDMTNGMNNMTREESNGVNNVDNGIVNTTGTNAGDYNTTRTTTEGTTRAAFNTMSTTTWMWIILAVAAIIIIAAIWYYATQNND